MNTTKMVSRRKSVKTRRRLTKAGVNVNSNEDISIQDNGERRYYVSHVDTQAKDRLLTGEHLKAMTRDICQRSGMALEKQQPGSIQEAFMLLENLGFVVVDLIDNDKHNRIKVETLNQTLKNDSVTLAELELLRVCWGNCVPVVTVDKQVISIYNPDEEPVADNLIPVNITPGGRFEPECVACPEAYLPVAEAKKYFGKDFRKIELKIESVQATKAIKINRMPPEI